jgi:hypothetical protein
LFRAGTHSLEVIVPFVVDLCTVLISRCTVGGIAGLAHWLDRVIENHPESRFDEWISFNIADIEIRLELVWAPGVLELGDGWFLCLRITGTHDRNTSVNWMTSIFVDNDLACWLRNPIDWWSLVLRCSIVRFVPKDNSTPNWIITVVDNLSMAGLDSNKELAADECEGNGEEVSEKVSHFSVDDAPIFCQFLLSLTF